MQLHQLEQFRAVARCEHMSKASAALHVAQPTLSLNISRLEDELGVKLFDRSGRNIRLNMYGREFLYRIERGLNELELAKQAILDMSDASIRKIRVADAILNNTYNILSEYLRDQPDAHFNHQTATLPEITAMMESGNLDLAIAVLPPEPMLSKQLQWEPVKRTRLMVLMPDSHPLATQQEVGLQQLKDIPIMYAIPGFDGRDAFDQYCKIAGFEPNYTYTSIKPFLFNELTREHGYFSIITESLWELGENRNPYYLGEYMCIDGIAGVRLREPECVVEYGIITCKGREMTKQARNFKSFVMNFLEKRVEML